MAHPATVHDLKDEQDRRTRDEEAAALLDHDDLAGVDPEFVEDPSTVLTDYVNDWASTMRSLAQCKRRTRIERRLEDEDALLKLKEQEEKLWKRLAKLDACVREEPANIRQAFTQAVTQLKDTWRKQREYTAPEGTKPETPAIE